MPRKRTHRKRRLDPIAGAEAWSDVFQTGFALFDDFEDATGVKLEPRVLPNGASTKPLSPTLQDSEAAWRAYGAAFLALYGRKETNGQPVWAIQNFGDPQCPQSA